uniref:Disease resistance protein At3g14460 n=1 Tax=Nicotiana tabacum TaxID=4097 RepID=A0A1S4BDC2_TOBAC|nr:PREDICTED: putative disease resistance protein At3g14460 [Nicotiana tabacum]
MLISHCKKLKSLPEHMQELLPSLKKLELQNCPEIESFPEGGLPFNLEVLKIWNCNKLVNGRKEWRLQRLSCLRDLIIYHDGSDEEIPAGENWELPCFIRRLTIYNLKTFSSQVLKSLTSLESLCIQNLPQIQALLDEGPPSSLSELTFRRLTSLPCSLSKLHIWNCRNFQSLPESGLPFSLSVLEIENCPNLQSLSEPALPSSLSKLVIWDCPKLQFLPLKGCPLPSLNYIFLAAHCSNHR